MSPTSGWCICLVAVRWNATLCVAQPSRNSSLLYHEKNDRYRPNIVGTVVSAESATTTLRLVLK